MSQNDGPSRRTVLRAGLTTGAAVSALGAASAAAPSAMAATAVEETGHAPARHPRQRTMAGVPFRAHRRVRVGIIGLGNRGMGMLPLWLAVPGVRVSAVCDLLRDRAVSAADQVEAAGQPRPSVHAGSEQSYRELCRQEDVDLVYVATPWDFHFEQGMAAMRGGKHVGIELPIATELHELWQLVDTSERTRRHCLLMENTSYGRNELALLRMAHDGLFGQLTNGHGGYLHDLRELMFGDHYASPWRRLWHTRRNGSFYPMHGLAPIATCMDVNRGDRFRYLAATSSAALGLAAYRAEHVPPGHPSWDETYVAGDLVTCMIETRQRRLVRAEHDVSSPRPYSRINSLAGTKGIFEDYEPRIYVEPEMTDHVWGDAAPYLERYDHWLWREVGDDAEMNGGHGGMDYLLMWRLVQTMRLGLAPDIDVYDSAAWCSPVPLSTMSLERDGRPVAVPDFTRGLWHLQRPGLDSEQPDVLVPAVG